MCDVIFEVDGFEIPAHKAILSARSEVFRFLQLGISSLQYFKVDVLSKLEFPRSTDEHIDSNQGFGKRCLSVSHLFQNKIVSRLPNKTDSCYIDYSSSDGLVREICSAQFLQSDLQRNASIHLHRRNGETLSHGRRSSSRRGQVSTRPSEGKISP